MSEEELIDAAQRLTEKPQPVRSMGEYTSQFNERLMDYWRSAFAAAMERHAAICRVAERAEIAEKRLAESEAACAAMRYAGQMAVDYYKMGATDFENKYPIRPPEPKAWSDGGCWTVLMVKAIAAYAAKGKS